MPVLKHIIQAARLRTLPLSVSGIILGSFLAYADDCFDGLIFTLAIFTTLGFQILSNFANDYGDGKKGTDNDERIGPPRAIQAGLMSLSEMKRLMLITTIVTLIVALALIYAAFGMDRPVYTLVFFLLGVASIVAALKYTIGSKAYGYSGFGDIFVFLFFGLLSVIGSYVLYAKAFHWMLIWPAISVGFLSVGVLHLNNMRDRLSDSKSGKHTIAVKLGEAKSKYYYAALVLGALVSALIYVYLHWHSFWQIVFVLAFLPILLQLLRVCRNQNPKALDPELKILALSTFLFSILFGLGQIL